MSTTFDVDFFTILWYWNRGTQGKRPSGGAVKKVRSQKSGGEKILSSAFIAGNLPTDEILASWFCYCPHPRINHRQIDHQGAVLRQKARILD